MCSEPGWCSLPPQWKWNWIVEYVPWSPPPLTSTSPSASLTFTAQWGAFTQRTQDKKKLLFSLVQVTTNKKVLQSLRLRTCMSSVYNRLHSVLRTEVDEGELPQVVVSLNMVGDDVNGRLSFPPTWRARHVRPVARGVFYARLNHRLIKKRGFVTHIVTLVRRRSYVPHPA